MKHNMSFLDHTQVVWWVLCGW